MDKMSSKNCDVCLRRGVQTKVRTICDECREFLCKECSVTHLLHKLCMTHSLIDLDSSGDDTRSANDDELASDFLEKATVSETTVLYRAQVAVENGSRIKKRAEVTKKSQREEKFSQSDDFKPLKATECREFSLTKRPGDKEKVNVRCILTLSDKIVIVDIKNEKLKLFDSSGKFLSSTDLKEEYTTGITLVDKDKFATCGWSSKVFLWTLRGDTIVSEDVTYDMNYPADGIHYSGTYYCVLHRLANTVTVLDRQGRRVKEIVMKKAFGREIILGFDIHMDSDTHDIYIPCWGDNRGVLCISVEGEALWFTPLSNAGPLRWFLRMSDADLWGITEIYDTLCVADGDNQCLYLISKTGHFQGKLLEKNELRGKPWYMRYDGHSKELYVNCKTYGKETMSVYLV